MKHLILFNLKSNLKQFAKNARNRASLQIAFSKVTMERNFANRIALVRYFYVHKLCLIITLAHNRPPEGEKALMRLNAARYINYANCMHSAQCIQAYCAFSAPQIKMKTEYAASFCR